MVNFVFRGKAIIFGTLANEGYLGSVVESRIFKQNPSILGFIFFELKLVFYYLLRYWVLVYLSNYNSSSFCFVFCFILFYIMNQIRRLNTTSSKTSPYMYICAQCTKKMELKK